MKRLLFRLYSALLLAVACAALSQPSGAAAQASGPLYSVELDGVITSYSVMYLQRALREAEAAQASALIITLQSEGAALRALRPFAVDVARSTVPVVVYVGPGAVASGAAGALLLSAAHIAALAPGASFGSPTPLATVDEALSDQSRNLVLDSVAQQLRSWNESRGRSAAWVERAVREGAILDSAQASATTPPSVTFVAQDQNELLTLLEGRSVTLQNGSTVQLHTLGRLPQPLEASLWEQILLLLARPTVAFLLLVFGAIAIYAEFASPGTSLLAGMGVVLLIGALIGLLVLPVRWLSVLGIVAAFALMGADLFVASHGGLTIAGVVLLVVGALTLIDPAQAPGVGVALWVIVLVAAIAAALAALGLVFALRSKKLPPTTGSEGLIGRLAEVRQRLDPDGMVFIEGALWRAISEDGEIEPGEWVRITAVHELRLLVKRDA